ncbi:hypothetical protein HK098_005864 [Nowakowskiella sp. JEL0407]|nr:hypothetical protein HK098_005864 [Nowakowskiella sp. JEL0407]
MLVWKCMTLFSDLPRIDMEQCILDTVNIYKLTPPSMFSHLSQYGTIVENKLPVLSPTFANRSKVSI